MLPKQKWRKVLLLGSSYYFYACFDVAMSLILLTETAVAYGYGLMYSKYKSKTVLAIIIVFLLLPLLCFKYFSFLIGTVVDVLSLASLTVEMPTLQLMLPVGISFYINMFIELCKQHDIKLVMMYSPYYNESSDDAIIRIKELAATKNVPFFDYCSNLKYQVPELFYDVMHLNDNGARLYTNEIVKYLKQ